MADEPEQDEDEPRGTVDLASVLYVVGGVPAMIVFFVVLFLMTNGCDGINTLIPV